jgi:ketol-acid reductoisomerase
MKTHSAGGKLTVYRDADADLDFLRDRSVVVIGCGNQGRAQALNLCDSGVALRISSIQDSSAERARSDGFEVIPIEGAARIADILMLLVPDEVQRRIYEESLVYIRSGKFAKEWAREERESFPRFNALVKEARRHPIGTAERTIAKLFDFGGPLAIKAEADSKA